MTYLRGFDVSHWQGQVDWQGLTKRHGLSFGFCKAGEAEAGRDSLFRENWAAMRAAGLVRGAYQFARPDANPEDDAQALVAQLRAAGLQPTDLVVLDLELSDLGRAATNHWARGWALEVRRLLPGYSPVLYAGAGYMSSDTGRGLNEVFGAWWYPRWPGLTSWPADTNALKLPAPNVWGKAPDFWQWTDRFPGGQNLDANVYLGTLAQLRAINPGARTSPPPPKPPVPPPTPAPRPFFILHRVLGVATPYMTGDDVREVQKLVRCSADGAYGPITANHVRAWQQTRHLTVDGVFGPQCAKAAGWGWQPR